MPVTCGVPAQPLARPVTRFDFAQPAGLNEALDLLAEHGANAAVVAGGTDLLRAIKLGNAHPDLVVSIARLGELTGIQASDAGDLEIGAGVTMARLARDETVRAMAPALAEAAAQVGSPQVRNRATIGGNLANASPCADSAPPCAVLDAQVVLQSRKGERRLSLSEFMTGPATTVRRPDELLTRVAIPAPGERTGSAYQTLTRRKALEITIASATARLSLASDSTVTTARVCLGSVAPTWLLSDGAAQALSGKRPTDETIASAARAAAQDATPIDDLRAAAQYRKWMVEVLTRRALTLARARAEGGQP